MVESSSTAPRWLLLAKMIVAPLGLVLLVYMLAGEAVSSSLPNASAWLVAAILVNQLALTLFALRMQRMLKLFGLELGLLETHRIHFQSLFYFFFVPMGVGLEIARYFKVRRVIPGLQRADLIVSLLSDRFIGVLAAALVALASLPFIRLSGLSGLTLDLVWLAALGLMLAVAAGAIVWRLGYLGDIARVWRATSGRRHHALPALAIGLLMQIAMGATVYLGALAFDIDASLAECLFAVAAGVFAMIIPLSALGVGPAEAVGVVTFVIVGLSGSEAALMASIGYAGRLIGALEGGLWELIEGGSELLDKD